MEKALREPRRREGRARLVLAGAGIVVGLVVFELAARVYYRFGAPLLGPRIDRQVDLRSYERLESGRCRGHWGLRAGYSVTLEEAIRIAEESGKLLRSKHLSLRGAELGYGPRDRLFSVNASGFKGPEIDATHRKMRVLTLGDSCTFGSFFDRYAYPRVLEAELQRRRCEVEVINAGVEGYSPRNVLCRIEELKELAPEVTTIYLGWNALWAEIPPFQVAELRFFGFRLLRQAGRQLEVRFRGRQQMAWDELRKEKNLDPEAAEVERLAGYRPTFMPEIVRIVREMKGAGSTVVLLTLPGLYDLKQPITADAVAKGHLPHFTENPYVLAKMSERFNEALRQLAAAEGAVLVDLEAAVRKTLKPRSAWYLDSVHLSEEGQVRIGRMLATALEPVLGCESRHDTCD